MLPPAHVSAGYVTSVVLLHFTPETDNALRVLGAGMIFGALPDVDYTFSFISRDPEKKRDHRRFCTHAPITWVVPGLVIAFLSSLPEYRYLALAAMAGALSHIILDSLDYGCMWLWPYSVKMYGLMNQGIPRNIFSERQGEDLLGYAIKCFKEYYSSQCFKREPEAPMQSF